MSDAISAYSLPTSSAKRTLGLGSQLACDTCGDATGQKNTTTPNKAGIHQGFQELNASLDKALSESSASSASRTSRPRVLVLGVGSTDPNDTQAAEHEKMVANILLETGVAKDDILMEEVNKPSSSNKTQTPQLPPLTPEQIQAFIDNRPETLKQELIDSYSSDLLKTTGILQKAEENNQRFADLKLGQINMSFSLSAKAGADTVFKEAEAIHPETGDYVFPTLRNVVYGETPPSEAKDRYDCALTYVNTVLKDSSKVQDARTAYRDQVVRLKNSGIQCVVAAGNENNQLYGTAANNGEAANLFCTANTINVGAADAEGKVAAFSNRSGSLNEGAITLTAFGKKVPIDPSLDTLDRNADGKIDGTSFAAPQVTGLLNNLSKRGLSPTEQDAMLKQLQKNGVIIDTEAPKNAEGLGFFNPRAFGPGVDLAA